MNHISHAGLGQALGTDFFSVREQFTTEQWSRFTAVRRFVDTEVIPAAAGYWERAEIPWALIRRLPELGIVGEDIKGYGCAGMSALASGLVTMELHRGDGSLGVALGVHSGLAMRSIALCGSDEQKERWLPAMARMELLGAFALNTGRLTATVAGLAKMHNTRKARLLAADARDMLGGNGILLDHPVIRHMADLEAIHTFEGTETMQTLIVSRDITGIGAFT
jgi:alkylation response protein AidB-like acyl-CoA dehydrogenase